MRLELATNAVSLREHIESTVTTQIACCQTLQNRSSTTAIISVLGLQTKLLLVLPSTSTKYTSVGPHAFGLAAIRQPVQPEALDFAKNYEPHSSR